MKISCAIITHGGVGLERAVASIRPHVDEVVALVTRPADLDTLARYQSLFDRFAVDAACFPLDDQGDVMWELADFAEARNRSFALASGDAILWMDDDDEIVGGENIRPLLEVGLKDAERYRILCRYEYTVHEGQVVSEQWRERIIRRGTPYTWKRPIHEHLTSDDGQAGAHDVKCETVTWRHHRPANEPRSDRNLRVALAHEMRLGEAAKADAWLHHTLAQELNHHGRFKEAMRHFEAYDQLSERVDEKAFAAAKASEVALALAIESRGSLTGLRLEDALSWCRKAQGHRLCFETLFAEANVLFLRGTAGGERDALEECRAVLERALATEETVTPLGTQPVARRMNAPELQMVVCEVLRDWEGALAAAERRQRHAHDPVVAQRARRYARLAGKDAGQGLDVAFVCLPSAGTWDPEIARQRGIGGSETAVIEVSRRLAAMGHMVRVFVDCAVPAVHDGVLWLPMTYVRDVGECDVAVAWRDASALDHCGEARVKVVWAHDLGVAHLTRERMAVMDRLMGVSAWHTEHLRALYGLPHQKMHQTRNGVDLARFEGGGSRDPHRAIYTSSPDRGLVVLLDLWPRIREQVPDATLVVYYGFQNVDKLLTMIDDLNFAYVAARCRRLLAELPGVTYHGRVDQQTLARAMMGAGVLAFPSAFRETSCISAMEAQAAGMRIVTSNLAALAETVGDRGVLLDGSWLSAEYQERFVTAVVDAMLVPGDEDRRRSIAYAREHFSWDDEVVEWELLFEKLLGERKTGGELPEYTPDPEWAATQ